MAEDKKEDGRGRERWRVRKGGREKWRKQILNGNRRWAFGSDLQSLLIYDLLSVRVCACASERDRERQS